jgi:hypothetical protein
MQMGKLPQEVDCKAPISLLLAKSKFWKEAIFDRAACGISRMQVDALFLSLTASEILQMQQKNTSLEWIITREFTTKNNCFIESHIGCPMYKKDVARGVHLFSESRVRKRNHGVSLTIDDN